MRRECVPGWHGKLPVLGDFASRRLDQDFLESWDGWLSAGMSALRERMQGAWLDAYLASPSWRFLLMPGVIGGEAGRQAWAGVLMPSVDRVGRYFPFTIAQALGDAPMSTAQMPRLWAWLADLDDLAAEAMHSDWSVDRLEAELANLSAPQLSERTRCRVLMPGSAPSLWSAVEAELDPAAWIAMEAQDWWCESARGIAYWYACAQQASPRLLRSRGLPDESAMQILFGGASVDPIVDGLPRPRAD